MEKVPDIKGLDILPKIGKAIIKAVGLPERAEYDPDYYVEEKEKEPEV